ncbi:hypothetical protein HNR00_004430 [Methylorubrum rhodinum]|uniref:Uncharacterized protein n=1 Tax=Methylorubrum rhodinum TaxID=29428 RepID=A0A840ZQ13_9HYPH|nr:hypothetical protein [Methylorubrum rhodinum]MBB5759696.1 hypothetical protein [Methylorubrum rhodinum]
MGAGAVPLTGQAGSRERGRDDALLREALARLDAPVIRYDGDEIQRLDLRYVHEIAETCPAGPVFVGGSCQGVLVALPVAQHLRRRGRHVPLPLRAGDAAGLSLAVTALPGRYERLVDLVDEGSTWPLHPQDAPFRQAVTVEP